MIAKGTLEDVLISQWSRQTYVDQARNFLAPPGLKVIQGLIRDLGWTGLILAVADVIIAFRNDKPLGLLFGIGFGLGLAWFALWIMFRSSISEFRCDLARLAEMVGRSVKELRANLSNEDWPKLEKAVEQELIAVRHRMIAAQEADARLLRQRYEEERRTASAFGFDVKDDAYYEEKAREFGMGALASV